MSGKLTCISVAAKSCKQTCISVAAKSCKQTCISVAAMSYKLTCISVAASVPNICNTPDFCFGRFLVDVTALSRKFIVSSSKLRRLAAAVLRNDWAALAGLKNSYELIKGKSI